MLLFKTIRYFVKNRSRVLNGKQSLPQYLSNQTSHSSSKTLDYIYNFKYSFSCRLRNIKKLRFTVHIFYFVSPNRM